MRLNEITSPCWYLALPEKMQVGSTVERMGSAYPLGALLEGRLEARRPADRLPRARTFFLLDQPPSSGAYIYEVKAVGQIDRQHTGWLQLLAKASATSVGEVDHYCGGYWSDLEVPELRQAPWEHRTRVVKLLSWIGGTEDFR